MAKNGNATLWKIISILVTIGILAGGAIYGYASLNHEVADNTEDIGKMDPKVETSKVDIIEMKKDISFLSQIVAENAIAIQQAVILQTDTNAKFDEIITELQKQ